MQLHQYQTNASNLLVERTENILNSSQEMTEVYLKAITGAGKTIIMSDYMDKVFDKYDGHKNIAFVWMSIGTGGLHQQSYQSLRNSLPLDIKLYSSSDFQSIEALNHKDVLVLNWETVNRMTIEDGVITYDNVSMKEGEKISLPRLFDQTLANGTKIVMIIDEAHIGAESPTTDDLLRTSIIKRQVIKPQVVVNVTATPKFAEEIPKRNIIEVDTESVIHAGRIKRQVRIDDTMDVKEDKTFVANVLNSAVSKQEHLKKLYQKEGNGHINPLCLVQIPNGKLGDEMKALAEEVLAERGYTYDKGNLAEVVDKNINMDTVKQSDSPVSFLINKQAISTGWDAPRAQIWVKLRDTKSAVFDAQTLGRILRMPKGKKVDDPTHVNYKFFEHDELNYAYVYTDANYSVSTAEYQAVFPTQKVLKEEYKEDVQSLVFDKQTIAKEPVKVEDIKVRQRLTQLVENHFDSSRHDFDELKVTVSVGSYATHDLEDEDTEVTTQEFSLTHESDIKRFTDEFFNRACGSVINSDVASKVLIKALGEHYDIDEGFKEARQWILANQPLVAKELERLKSEAVQHSKVGESVESDSFSFPETVLINERMEEDIFHKSAYTKEPLSAFGTEQAFEEIIDNHPNVKWWIKNKDAGKDGLSIAYNEKNKHLQLFYPDYIVRFNDGSLGIYETKSLPDLNSENTLAKERALLSYINATQRKTKDADVFGGIVYMEKTRISQVYEIKESHDNDYPELKVES